MNRGVAACLLVALLAIASLLPRMTGGTEMVRIRNALMLGPELNAAADWQPPAEAGWGYLREDRPALPHFVQVADRLKLSSLPDDWSRAVAISAHLLGSVPVLLGGPIQDDLVSTYQRITEQGDGYCGDFIRAFHAIAHAAGMTTRSWSFSFDGFGGHGHVWAEIWNSQLQQWQLLDVFDNYYFTDGDSRPLSALAFHRALVKRSPTLALNPIFNGSRLGFDDEAKAWDYFRRGADQWYMVWGDNVGSYDQALLVRLLGGVSRSLEQLGGIAQGVQPGIRILPSPTNQLLISDLRQLRLHVMLVALVVPLALLAALVLALRKPPPRRRQRRRSAE